MEVNLPPTIELSGDSIALACDGDELRHGGVCDDPGDAATINWPFPGNDNVLENEYTWTQYADRHVGGDRAEWMRRGRPTRWKSRRRSSLCLRTTTCVEKARPSSWTPLPGDQNTDLVYEWTYNGNEVDDVNDNEWEVSETGSYCVTITDGCPPNGESDCAFIDIVAEPLTSTCSWAGPSPTAMEAWH